MDLVGWLEEVVIGVLDYIDKFVPYVLTDGNYCSTRRYCIQLWEL